MLFAGECPASIVLGDREAKFFCLMGRRMRELRVSILPEQSQLRYFPVRRLYAFGRRQLRLFWKNRDAKFSYPSSFESEELCFSVVNDAMFSCNACAFGFKEGLQTLELIG